MFTNHLPITDNLGSMVAINEQYVSRAFGGRGFNSVRHHATENNPCPNLLQTVLTQLNSVQNLLSSGCLRGTEVIATEDLCTCKVRGDEMKQRNRTKKKDRPPAGLVVWMEAYYQWAEKIINDAVDEAFEQFRQFAGSDRRRPRYSATDWLPSDVADRILATEDTEKEGM